MAEHFETLQEISLSNTDRLRRDHREYMTVNGPITEDDYLGKVLAGKGLPKRATGSDLKAV